MEIRTERLSTTFWRLFRTRLVTVNQRFRKERHLISNFISELKAIFGLLTEWSKHLNQVNLKFEDDEQLSQFVIDVLWYELAYRLLGDRHGISHKEAKEKLEKSPELINVNFE